MLNLEGRSITAAWGRARAGMPMKWRLPEESLPAWVFPRVLYLQTAKVSSLNSDTPCHYMDEGD